MIGQRLRLWSSHMGVFVVILVVLAPFAWIAYNSLRPNIELIAGPKLIPEVWTPDNYRDLLGSTPFWQWTRNTTLVALGTLALTLPLSVMAAYSVYRTRYWGRNVMALSVLSAYVFPTALLAVPIFGLFNNIGLLDSLLGLAVINSAIAIPFGVWLLQAFLHSLPPELEEAAAVDGAGRVRTIALIVIPQIAPGIFVVAVFAMIVAWTEFLFASVLILDDDKRVLAVGMATLLQGYTVDWGRLAAGAVLTGLPVIVFFTLTARWFVRGISAGTVD